MIIRRRVTFKDGRTIVFSGSSVDAIWHSLEIRYNTDDIVKFERV